MGSAVDLVPKNPALTATGADFQGKPRDDRIPRPLDAALLGLISNPLDAGIGESESRHVKAPVA